MRAKLSIPSSLRCESDAAASSAVGGRPSASWNARSTRAASSFRSLVSLSANAFALSWTSGSLSMKSAWIGVEAVAAELVQQVIRRIAQRRGFVVLARHPVRVRTKDEAVHRLHRPAAFDEALREPIQ